jgi:hypothetical protein
MATKWARVPPICPPPIRAIFLRAMGNPSSKNRRYLALADASAQGGIVRRRKAQRKSRAHLRPAFL